jgi:hypothetical protein
VLFFLPFFVPKAIGSSISHNPGMILARGYNVLSGEVKGDCVNYEHLSDSTIGNALSYTFHLSSIINKSELSEELKLSSAVALKASRVAGVSAKADFLKSGTISAYNVNLVSRVDVSKPFNIIKNARLKDDFAQLAANDLVEFENRCGNHWIMGMQNGGEFIGLLSIETESDTEQKNILIETNGQYVTFTGQGSFTEEFQQKVSHKITDIKIYVRGGSAEKTYKATLEGLIQKAQSFHSEVEISGGTPKAVLLQSYSVLPNWPGGDISSNYEYYLQNLAKLRWQFESLKEDIRYINRYTDQFYLPQGLQPLDQLNNEINLNIREIDIAVEICTESNGENCEEPQIPKIEDYYIRLPLRYAGVCDERKILELPAIKVFPLVHSGKGDTEMRGHNPNISIEAKINMFGLERLNLNTTVVMEESTMDYSTFIGTNQISVFNITAHAPHCIFRESGVNLTEGHLKTDGGNDNWNETEYYGTGLIESAKCTSDTNGDDKDKLGCSEIKFNPISVFLMHEEDGQKQ